MNEPTHVIAYEDIQADDWLAVVRVSLDYRTVYVAKAALDDPMLFAPAAADASKGDEVVTQRTLQSIRGSNPHLIVSDTQVVWTSVIFDRAPEGDLYTVRPM